MSRVTTTYNPHLLAREELVTSFVARRGLLDHLVEDLRGGGHQHHLLVGARGSGKTTLLLRLAVAIEDDKKLARSALPLRFPEEQYNVARPSDFWLNCLDALADALEARGDHGGKRKLESSIATIEAFAEEDRSPAALTALTQWANQAQKLLVLLVDNLGLLLERLRETQWGLREALSRDNRLVLIGASSSFLEESSDYQSPFYDFFNVHELGQLPENEARELVETRAVQTGASAVQAVLENDPGRFKALYVLTGGMPRMLALLASVLSVEGPAESDLERMLDQLTPYYKARFDELPPQAQILVDAVALHWHPVTAAACAERTRLDINIVSAQLNRLVKLGLLAKVSLPGASKLGFQLVERFFNIWYLMRASRRARQKLAWFVEFLRLFYSEAELSRRAQVMLDRDPDATSPTHVLALASAVPDAALRRRLECRAVTMLIEGIRSDRIHDLLDLSGDDAHLSPVVDRARTLKELRTRLGPGSKLRPLGLRILRDPMLKVAEKSSYIARLAREGAAIAAPWRAREPFVRWADDLGETLVAAVARGEAPSLREVMNVDEAAAILELTQAPQLVTAIVLTVVNIEQPTADDIIAFLIEQSPNGRLTALAVAARAIDDWPRARALARHALLPGGAAQGDAEWRMATQFFGACVRNDQARQAAELLAELGLQDHWMPCHEALLALAGDRDRLARLAPEVRAPIEELLAHLKGEDFIVKNEAPRDPLGSPAPKLREPRIRNARRKPTRR